MFLLIISLVLPVHITFAQSQTAAEGQFPQSIIAASSTDTTPHVLELRATQDGDNAEPKKVSGFKLDMTNVVAAQVNSQLLVFVTDSSVKVSEAKVRTVSDRLIDLVPSSQANAFSLANLPVGVYTLDVMTQKGNAKAAYEGILVLGQEPTNAQTKTIIERQIIREERDDGDDEDDRDCDPSYPDTCIPPPPPNLNCDDISFRNFKVTGGDPHGFDRDNDGIGCESTSSNGGNNGDDGNGGCIEDGGHSLSEGSYIDDRGFIVGSPCDPVEFCEDEGSTNPTVVDYCDDIWDDTDECIIDPSTCDLEECPEGQTGTPPDCTPICPEGEECPPDECPPGTTGTPPDCEPIEDPGICPPGTTGTPPDCEPIEDPGICPPGTTGTPPDCEPIDDIALPTDEEDQETEGGDEFEGGDDNGVDEGGDEGESGDGDEQGGEEEGGNQ
jgi:hypothetical protein